MRDVVNDEEGKENRNTDEHSPARMAPFKPCCQDLSNYKTPKKSDWTTINKERWLNQRNESIVLSKELLVPSTRRRKIRSGVNEPLDDKNQFVTFDWKKCEVIENIFSNLL